MLITKEFLKSLSPCSGGYEYWLKTNKPDLAEFMRQCLIDKCYDYAHWLFVRSVDEKTRVKYALYAAELVEPIYTEAFQNDGRVSKCTNAIRNFLEDKISADELKEFARDANLAFVAASKAADAAYNSYRAASKAADDAYWDARAAYEAAWAASDAACAVYDAARSAYDGAFYASVATSDAARAAAVSARAAASAARAAAYGAASHQNNKKIIENGIYLLSQCA